MDASELCGLNILQQDDYEHVVFQVVSQFLDAEPENEFIDHQNLDFLVFEGFILKKTKKVMCFSHIEIKWLVFHVFLDVLDKLAYLNVYLDLVDFGCFLVSWTLLVHNEALDHVLWEDEASNGESYLFKELIMFNT